MFFFYFDPFIPVLILETCKFISSVLFGTHILFDNLLKVLKLALHLPILTENG